MRPTLRATVGLLVAVIAVLTLTGVTGLAGPTGTAGATTAAAAATSTTTTPPTTTTTTPPRAGQRPPTRGPADPDPKAIRPVGLDVVGGLLEGAPIMPGDFADPFALAEPGAVYLYATNTTTANIPVIKVPRATATSRGAYLGDALPDLPSWTVKGNQWAPAVYARPDGTFVLYYATPAPAPEDGSPRRQCISRATADDPGGPFADDSDGPLVCPLERGGAIDPSIVIDDAGSPYLLWKSDGDCCGLPTDLYSQPLSADGTELAGPPSRLLVDSESWQADLIEAPSMVQDGDRYLLFYSANDWATATYAVGVAECESVTGPCRNLLGRPWMTSADRYSGPGGQEFFDDQGAVWMVHHGFLPGQAGPFGVRRLYLDKIEFPSRGDGPPTRVGTAAAVDSLAFWALVVPLLVTTAVACLVAWRVHRRRLRATPTT